MIYKVPLAFLSLFISSCSLAEESSEIVPMTKVIANGGWPMAVLGILSLFAIFLVSYFLCTLRMGVLFPRTFQLEVEDIAYQGDIVALDKTCRGSVSIGASIIGAVAQLLATNPEAEYIVIRDVIEDEGNRQSNALWQRIQYLMDIAVVAPMIGLLGTVLGMIQAFVGLQTDFGAVKPIALASGVSKALVTTAGGLIVGIICMLLYSYFRGHVNRLLSDLEERCGDIIHLFAFNRKNNS